MLADDGGVVGVKSLGRSQNARGGAELVRLIKGQLLPAPRVGLLPVAQGFQSGKQVLRQRTGGRTAVERLAGAIGVGVEEDGVDVVGVRQSGLGVTEQFLTAGAIAEAC